MVDNFCKYCILQGAEIFPLNVSSKDSDRLGICNPSIFDDGDTVYLSLRNVNYMLYQNLNKRFQTRYGETVYCTPDNDYRLITRNYIAKYNIETNKVEDYKLIDTSKFDIKPVWEFVGHEDIRLVRWNNKLYATGCRRDVKTNGESRMELSEIDPETGKELSRIRIKAPGDNTSYCEKNWMPVLDKPFHYIKWSNPVELVKVNPETGDCESLFIHDQNKSVINTFRALRGSSQVIPYKDGYIYLSHEVDLWLNELERKDCKYYMKFVVMDKDFNIVKTSDEFAFLNFSIEFTNGMMHKNGYFYIPFAIMDNISFMLKVREEVVDNFINGVPCKGETYIKQQNNIYKDICLDNSNPEVWFKFGEILLEEEQYSQAATCFARCIDEKVDSLDDMYRYIYSLAFAFSGIGERDIVELSFWENCINLDSSRSEGYVNLARYYNWRGDGTTAYMFAKLAYEKNNYKRTTSKTSVNRLDTEIMYYELMYKYNDKTEAHTHLINLKNNLTNLQNNKKYNLEWYVSKIDSVLDEINTNALKFKKII